MQVLTLSQYIVVHLSSRKCRVSLVSCGVVIIDNNRAPRLMTVTRMVNLRMRIPARSLRGGQQGPYMPALYYTSRSPCIVYVLGHICQCGGLHPRSRSFEIPELTTLSFPRGSNCFLPGLRAVLVSFLGCKKLMEERGSDRQTLPVPQLHEPPARSGPQACSQPAYTTTPSSQARKLGSHLGHPPLPTQPQRV